MTISKMGTSPGDISKHTAPTQQFLCSLAANTYNIEFTEFQIKDYDSKETIFHIKAPEGHSTNYALLAQLSEEQQRPYRMVSYEFPEKFLRLATVSTTLTFRVNGETPCRNFRMLERHYFKGRLIREYDFTFPFCIPHSTNSWESVYEVPPLSQAQIDDFINSPGEHKSDSFYFVDGQLIMHNKAAYAYKRDPVPATPTTSH